MILHLEICFSNSFVLHSWRLLKKFFYMSSATVLATAIIISLQRGSKETCVVLPTNFLKSNINHKPCDFTSVEYPVFYFSANLCKNMYFWTGAILVLLQVKIYQTEFCCQNLTIHWIPDNKFYEFFCLFMKNRRVQESVHGSLNLWLILFINNVICDSYYFTGF